MKQFYMYKYDYAIIFQFLGTYFDGQEAMVYSKTHNNCNHEVFNQFTYYLVKNPLFQESIENEVFPNKMHYIAQSTEYKIH